MRRLALGLGALLLLASPAWADQAEGMFGVPRGGAPVKSEIPFPVRVGGTGNDSYVTGRCLETWTDGGVIRFRSSTSVCAPGDVPTPTATLSATPTRSATPTLSPTPTPVRTIAQVGNCASGYCFNSGGATLDASFELTFSDSGGLRGATLRSQDPTAGVAKVITVPAQNGTLAIAAAAPLTLSAAGVIALGPTPTATPTLSPTPTATRSPTPTITATPAGSGDITSVGDCLTGDCFGASSAQSDCLYFGNDGAGNAITVCPGGAPSSPKTIFWPLAYDGVVVVSCLPPLYCIDGQIFLATPSPTRTPTPTPTVTSTAPTATSTPSGAADCTGAPTLACLAGRTGGQTLYGSDTTTEGLTFIPNSADTTGTVNVIDPAKFSIGQSAVYSGASVAIGELGDPLGTFFGQPTGTRTVPLVIASDELPYFFMYSNTSTPQFFMVSLADAVTAPAIQVIRARGGGAQLFAGDGLFLFSAYSLKADGSETPALGGFGFEADSILPDYLPTRLGFSIMMNDGARRHPVYFYPSDLITLGADLRDSVTGVTTPTDHTVHMESPSHTCVGGTHSGDLCGSTESECITGGGTCTGDGDKTTVVIRATDGQTANLTQWRAHDDTNLAWIDSAGAASVPNLRFTGTIPTCGTGCASLSAASTNNDMDITVSAGVVTAVTVNFSATLTNTPICTASTDSATVGGAAVTAHSTTAVTFGTTATIGSGHLYAHCFEAS